jgi:hypothetical protein
MQIGHSCPLVVHDAGVNVRLGCSSEQHGERPAGEEYAMSENVEPQDIESAEFDDELSDEAIDREAGDRGPICCSAGTIK